MREGLQEELRESADRRSARRKCAVLAFDGRIGGEGDALQEEGKMRYRAWLRGIEERGDHRGGAEGAGEGVGDQLGILSNLINTLTRMARIEINAIRVRRCLAMMQGVKRWLKPGEEHRQHDHRREDPL